LKKFFAIVNKEFLLIIRDIPALATLFIMPVVLLVVITLSQENAMLKDNSGIRIAIVNSDSSVLGDSIINSISRSGSFNFICVNSEAEARKSVASGKFQVMVVIPEKSTRKLFSLLSSKRDTSNKPDDLIADISFVYDPGLQSVYKESTVGPLKELIRMSALRLLVIKYTELVSQNKQKEIAELEATFSSKAFREKIPDFPYRDEVIARFREEIMSGLKKQDEGSIQDNPLLLPEFLKIKEEVAVEDKIAFKPNPLQNNVPALTLFAMFFIVIPLAGSILGEKNLGVYDRMRTLPVTYLQIISAKVFVYVVICILQFIVLMWIGVSVMPLISKLQPLDLNVSFFALIIALIACSLAATGFGVLIGTLSRTMAFAATFGSVMVVILGMIGGIFVPVHILPDSLKHLSWISPLRWGTDAFLGVFARSGGIGSIWLQLVLLFLFFSVSLSVSLMIFYKRD
jgi:ABC-2 type transport system permease protein